MKKIFIDPGEFYIKVLVFDGQIPDDRANSNKNFSFYGRTFFPALIHESAQPTPTLQPTRQSHLQLQSQRQPHLQPQIHYENNNQFYQIGYDCSGIEFNEFHQRFIDYEYSFDKVPTSKINHNNGKLFINKCIFDFTIDDEEVLLYLVVDSPTKLQLFKEIFKEIPNYEILAYRELDKRIIRKKINLQVNFAFASDGASSLTKSKFNNYNNALVVDIGHSGTKLYTINSKEGIRSFSLLEIGMNSYYKRILESLQEKGIINIDYFWLIKQIEVGLDDIEVPYNESVYNFDPSSIIENIRWDFNKNFNKEIANAIHSYFTKLTAAIDSLLIMGGGAVLNGDIIRASLINNGYNLQSVYIEKSPMYNILQGSWDYLNYFNSLK